MIRFSIGGEYLDLPADFSLQFKKSNVLFAFDNMECERSTSFDIPATPQNDRIFKLAKWEQTTGDGMRRRFDAQMEAGVVIKSGYLYVDSYDFKKNAYKAIFITGELLGLKTIKDAGNIDEIIQPYISTKWGDEVDAGVGASDWWKCIKYKQQFSGTPYPSVQVGETIRQCFTRLGVTGTLPQVADEMRIIPKELTTKSSEVRFKSYTHIPQSSADRCNTAEVNNEWFELADINIYDIYAITRVEAGFYHSFDWYRNDQVCKMQGFKTKLTLQITFPESMPDDVALIGEFAGRSLLSALMFSNDTWKYGNIAQFNASGGTGGDRFLWSGTLKGQTITIPANTTFAFFKSHDMFGDDPIHYSNNQVVRAIFMQRTGWGEYKNVGQPAYEYMAEIKTTEPIEEEQVMLLPHLPNCTLVDLLKICANVSGNVLNYSDSDGVTFETLQDISTWRVIDLSNKVIGKKTMQRKFSDYKQNNYVQFDSDKFVNLIERIKINYTIDNQNLESEKDLQIIGYSEAAEGSMDENVTYTPILIKNPDQQNTEKATICLAGQNDTYLGRIYLTKNQTIQELCDESTAVDLSANMSLFEFSRIVPKTLFYYNGVKYVWTEAQYSKDVVTLKLSKINA